MLEYTMSLAVRNGREEEHSAVLSVCVFTRVCLYLATV